MKKFSLSKWILLGAALTFTYACTGQRQDGTEPKKEQDDDRDDGDMCEVQTPESSETHISSSEEKAAPKVAKETIPAAIPSVKKAVVPAPEVKAEAPVLLETVEKEKTVEASIPLENVKAVSETSAV